MSGRSGRAAATTFLARAGAFALVWWALSGGVPSSWWIGAPAVLLAALASVALVPRVGASWSGVLRFVPFFAWRSLLGGVDVARRAFHPRLPIAPGLVEHALRLPPGLPRVFMANTVSLLPGTLSAELADDVLTVHVLDREKDAGADLAAVERAVARLFGVVSNPSE